MWCKNCRQDVPAISSAQTLMMSCTGCGAVLSSGAEQDAPPPISAFEAAGASTDFGGSPSPLGSYPSFDDWEVEQNVRHLQARVGRRSGAERPTRGGAKTASRKPIRRVHSAHASAPRPHQARPRARRRTSLFDWAVLLLELLAFACGAALIGWSFVGTWTELWNLGVPIEVAGQVSLLLGLMLQLERIWQNSRYSVRKLEQFDARLYDLQQSAAMLGSTHTSAAQAFYAHMADEADPHLLLADLKGQLDLVAMSISKRSA